MQYHRFFRNAVLLALALLTALFVLTACSGGAAGKAESAVQTASSSEVSPVVGPASVTEEVSAPEPVQSGQIYLYGEAHGVSQMMDKEFELWREYYQTKNMRHLFIESSYFGAEYMNLWMKSDSDELLTAIYDDLEGTAAHNPYFMGFYKKIKEQCPETVFHGTDVGHQYASTGYRYIEYLKSEGLEKSEQFKLAQVAIEQGKRYYEHSDEAYREKTMVENFKREFDKLDGESVMGIYGAFHTPVSDQDGASGSDLNMASQLYQIYGDAIHTEDLTYLMKAVEPYRVDALTVNGKSYDASYFGSQDLTLGDYASREFWRLEDAYDDFKEYPNTGEILPYNNYNMQIETGQVFVIDYTKPDGAVSRRYYRSDGRIWEGMPSTEAFTLN